MVPKTWQDQYGDWIKKTAKEISECLNAMVDDEAKFDGSLRSVKKPAATTKPKKKWKPKNKWRPKKKPKNNNNKKWPVLTKEEWKAKQERKRQREQN